MRRVRSVRPKSRARLVVAAALLLGVHANAVAAPVSASDPARANVNLRLPIAIENPADLDFATLMVMSAGTARINPYTGEMRTTGGVTHIAGMPNAAWYRVTTGGLGLVIITLPSGPVTLRRQGGTETMTVSNWTLDGSTWRLSFGSIDFRVGATLNVSANQREGVYSGEFTVVTNYP